MPAPANILSFEQARHVVEEHAAILRPRGKELVELLDSPGQILAEQVHADRNFPPFPRATRDGYAVRAADLAKLPATLQVVAEIKAGAAADATLKVNSGQAAAIMTGAPAPPGSDAVVMVEYTSRESDQVTITKGIEAGDNIVPVGAEAQEETNCCLRASASIIQRLPSPPQSGDRACWCIRSLELPCLPRVTSS